MKNEKELMRAMRLCVSEVIYRQSSRVIDEPRMEEIAAAKAMLAQTRAIDLVDTLATLARSGLPMEMDLSKQVRFTEEQSPGRRAGRY